MFCPHNDPECRCGEFCITSIWGTPRNAENHARQIRRVVDGCTGRDAFDDEELTVKEYEFTLKFALDPEGVDIDDSLELLADCGCDDAIVGIGQKGRLALAFLRAAASPDDAILSGITDVRCALPHAELIEATPDFVGLTDVADLLSVSRQNVRKLIFGCDTPAPKPIHEGRPTIWHLAKVLEWLRREKVYAVDDDLLALAETTMQVNLAVTQRDAVGASQEQIRARLE
jgi:hypothetical protein